MSKKFVEFGHEPIIEAYPNWPTMTMEQRLNLIPELPDLSERAAKYMQAALIVTRGEDKTAFDANGEMISAILSMVDMVGAVEAHKAFEELIERGMIARTQ